MSVMHNVTRAVHDRVSQSSSGYTMCHSCEGPINSMDLNRDASHAVVAGRNVFKIFSIEEDKFEEKVNLRVGRNLNLNFSTADVAWNHSEDHILASAATNGHVVIWDLSRPTKSKQDYIFQDHKRTVNRVRFHAHEPYYLLSGSQDGSMKLFDMRSKTVSTTFSTGTTSVRDVQFCPTRDSYFIFASADESGNIQIWDLRRPDRVEKQFTGHSGPVFCIDWHLEEKNWLATAGRDKMIKVWDLTKSKSETLYQLQNIGSVARIRWRPQRKYQIASCSLILDCSINVWDFRRPYVPFASFLEHKDIPTGIVWKREDPHVFYSVAKDSYLFQHLFKDALRPADSLIPSGIDMNVLGNVFFATTDKSASIMAKSSSSSNYSLNVFNRPKKPDRTDRFTSDCSSNMFIMNNINESMSMAWFVDSAKRYYLHGHPLGEMCENNARVAEDYERYEVAQSWRMLKELYHSSSSSSHTSTKHRTVSVMSAASEKQDNEKGKTGEKLTNNDKENEEESADVTSGLSDEESDRGDIEKNLSNIARGKILNDPPEEWDIFFGDGDKFSYEMNAMEPNPQYFGALPSEAFQPRHPIKDRHSDNPLDVIQNGHDSPSYSNNESESNPPSNYTSARNSIIEEEVLMTFSNDPQLPNLQFSSLVSEMMTHYAEQGDVQTPVSMLIVLGDKLRPQIEFQIQENWFLSYIELLHRFKLWSKANEIIKLSHLPQICMLNQQSTLIHINCKNCSRPLQRVGWLCDRCKIITNICSICHHTVKGRFVWCQGCSHGGHMDHMREWFLLHRQCPAGCGHICQYT